MTRRLRYVSTVAELGFLGQDLRKNQFSLCNEHKALVISTTEIGHCGNSELNLFSVSFYNMLKWVKWTWGTQAPENRTIPFICIYISNIYLDLKMYSYKKEQQQKKAWQSLHIPTLEWVFRCCVFRKKKIFIFCCFSSLFSFIYLVFCRVGRRWGRTRYNKLLSPWIYSPRTFFPVWWEAATW